jgi:hypothetical protein
MDRQLRTAGCHEEKIPEFGESEMANSRKVFAAQRIRNGDAEELSDSSSPESLCVALAAPDVYASIRVQLCYLVNG